MLLASKLKHRLQAKWILLTTVMRLKWLMIRRKLIGTANPQLPLMTSQTKSWRITPRRFGSEFSTLVRDITTNVARKKKLSESEKSWNAFLNDLSKRTRNLKRMSRRAKPLS